MNKLRTALVLYIFTFTLLACHKSESRPTLTMSDSTILLDSAVGGVSSFKITANVDWTLAVTPAAATNWLQLSQTAGNGNATIKLTITGHNTNVTQPVTITVTSADNSLPPQTITLNQQGALQVSSNNAGLPGTPGTDVVIINTGLAWKAAASASWIHLDTTQGAGTYWLKISADTNRTGNVQNGTVTLTALNNSSVAPVTINVKQNAFYALYNFSPLTGPAGSNITLNGYFPSTFTVTFNGSSSATIVSHTATQIVCTVPANATSGYISVTIPSVSPALVSTQQFTVLNAWIQLSDNTAGLNTNNQPSLIYTYNGTLYFGWGNSLNQTIYSLDTTNYHWVPALTIPSSVQVVQYPTWYILGTKLYIGGGYSNTALSWYEYDLTQGNSPSAWRTLTSLPESMLNGNGYAVGGTGYVQSGEFSSAGNNLLYKFYTSGPSDPGTWTTLGALNVQDGPAASFILGNTVYFGGGSANASDPTLANAFFSMTPPSMVLSTIAPIPEPVNPSPAQRFSTWTVGDIAYAYDESNRTLFSYDPTANSWTQISTIPAPASGNLIVYATYYNGHVLAWDHTGAVYEYTGSL